MENTENSQLELFSKVPGSEALEPRRHKPLFNYIRNYEKVILIIIGFIVTGIISFSFGVEKGRRITSLKSNARIDLAAKVFSPVPSKEIKQITVAPAPVAQIAVIKSLGNYTIQVASYTSKSGAQQEASALRKKGFSALVMSSGKHTVVCVGNFSDKETAKSFLVELKKQSRYQDAIVRRL